MRDEDEAPRRRKRPDSGDLRLDSPLTEMDGVKEPKRRRQAVRLGVAVAGAAVLGAAAHLGVGSALTSVLSTDSSASSPSPSADPASSNTSSIPVLDQDPESPPPGSVWYREDLGVLRMQSGLFGVLTLANLDPTVGYVKALPDKTSLAGLTVLSAGVSDTELLGISPTGGLLLDPTNALGVYTKNNTLDDTHGNMVAVGSVTAANFVGELDTAKLGAEPFLFGAFASGQFLYFNGTDWVNEPLSSVAVTSLNGLTGAVTIRAGNAGIAVATSSPDINISLAELDVGTLGGGAFSMAALAAGQLLYYNGTDWVNTPLVAGTGIGVSGLTISNTGVLSLNGSTGALTLVAGTAISISGLTITNTGVTSAVAGNGVSVSSATGAVTYSLVLNGTTLSLGTGGLSVNLANANVWTGVQTFPAASLTNAELAGPVVTGLTTVTAVGLTLTASGSGVGAYAYTPSVTFGGDVLGTSFSSMTVAGIRGVSVVITSLTTGNILQYNGTDWVNVAPGSVSVTSLNGLTGAITLQSPGSTLTVTTSSPDIDLDIDLAHANTWTGVQSFPAASIPNATLAGPLVTGLATETAAGITLTASGSGVGTYAYTPSVSLGGDLSGSSLAAATLYAIQGIPVVITTLAVGNFLYYNGTDWVNQSLAAGQGISVSGYTVTNTGVLSLQGSTGALSLTAGTGIGISSLTITNTGVTSLVAGTNVSLSAATGAVTVSVVNAPTFSGIVTMEGGATFPGVASSNTATVENSPTIDLLGSYWNGTASIPYGSRLYWVQSATTPAGRLSFNLNNNGTITEVFAIDQAGNVTVGTWQATAVANAYLAGPLVDSISVVASGGITQSVSNPAGVGATTLTLGLSAVPNSSLAGPLVSSLTTVTAAGITLTATNPSGVGAGYYTPSVSIGGDLSGSTLSSLTVAKLQTYTLTISAPSANEVLVYNGTDWVNASVPATAGVTSLNGLTGALSIAAGNAGITVGTSGSDVNVSLAELDAGTLDGKAFSFSVLASGNLLEYNGTDWVNASLVAGTAISVSGLTITNTGVTSAVAGTGISVSAATGAVTITNTGIISLSAGTGVAISGTNPATISLSGNFVTSLTTESGSGITLTATNPSGLGAAYYVPSITSNLDVGAFGILFSAIADSSVSGKLFLSSTTANAMKYYDTQATPVLHQLATLDAGSIPNSALAGSLVDSVSVAVSGGLTQSVSGPSGVGSVTITLGIAAGGIANASLAGPLVTGLTTVTAAGITLTASGSGVGAYAYTPSVTLGGDLSGSSLGAATLYAIQSVPIVITTLTSGQVLQYNGTDWVNAAIPSAPVSSVSNSDGTLTISPTTGAVVASLNLAHANTWTATQTFPSGSLTNTELAGPVVTGLTTESGAGITLTASGSGVGAYAYTPSITGNLVVGAYGVVLDAIADASTAGKLFLSSTTANTLKFYDTQATPALHVLVDSLNVGSYAVTSIVAGTAISVSGSTGAVTVTNTGVTSAVAGNGVAVSSATGAVTFSAVLNGSTLSLASTGLSLNLGNANTWSAVQTFGTNLSFLGAQVSGTIATGDFLYYNGTNWIGQSLGAGTGISVSGATITNTGVTSAVAGTGISVSAATGAVTISLSGNFVTSLTTESGAGITLTATNPSGLGAAYYVPSVTLGGDLSGSSLGAATVAKISGVPVSFTSIATGNFLYYNGTDIINQSLAAGTGISISDYTITNSGVTSLVAGTAISVSAATGAVTVTNTGVTSLAAGTGVSVSGSTGAVTVSLSGNFVTSLTTESGSGITLTATNPSGLGAAYYVPSITGNLDVGGFGILLTGIADASTSGKLFLSSTTANTLKFYDTQATPVLHVLVDSLNVGSYAVTGLVAGTGISVSGSTGSVTVTNAGVTSLTAGTGIAVSGSTGGVTVSISAIPNSYLSGPLVSSLTTESGAGITLTATNPGGVGAAYYVPSITSNLNIGGFGVLFTGIADASTSGKLYLSSTTANTLKFYDTQATPALHVLVDSLNVGSYAVTGLVAGTAISISGTTGSVTVTNTGVTSAVAGNGISVSAATGAVTFSAVLNGTTLSLGSSGLSLNLGNANTWTAVQTFGTDISFMGEQVSGSTITAGSFLYDNGTNWVRQSLAAGTGISVSDYTITNTGVTSLAAGNAGVTVSASTGAVSVSLAELDVGTISGKSISITSLASGQALVYNGTDWVNESIVSGTFVASLNTLTGALTLTSPNSTLTIGTSGSDVTADINLGHANTWTASQTVGNGTAAAYYLSVRANWGGVTNPIGSAPNAGAYFGWNYTNGSAETDLVAQTNGATGNTAAFNFYLASTTGSLTLLASIHANGGMYSLNNTLDDGSGNMTVAGVALTMSSFSSSNTTGVGFYLDSNAGGTGTNAQKYYWARRANTSFGHGTNVDYALAIYNGTIWVEGIGFDYTNSQMSTDLGLVVGGPATFDAKILQSTSSTGSDGMWQEWNWLGGDSLSNAYAGSLLFSVNGNSLWELATAGVSTNSTGGLTAGVVEFYSYRLGTGVLNMNLFTGAVSLGGALSLSSHMILLSGNETSAGFQNDIQITDTGASSGQHKFIRSFGGQFQVINSAYTVALLSLDDSGNMTVPGTLGLTGLATFNAGITGTGTTGALQPGTGMLGNANTWTALQTFSGGISAKGIVSSVTQFTNAKYNSSSLYTTSSITAGPMGTYIIFAQFVSSDAIGGVTFYQDGATQYWESLQESTVANFHIGQTSGGAAQGTAGYPLVLQMVSSGFTPGTGHTFGWSAGDLYSYDVIIIAL